MNTYEQLKDYLLRNINKADSRRSKANKSFTREQMWDFYLGMVNQKTGNLPIRTKDILVKNVKKDF